MASASNAADAVIVVPPSLPLSHSPKDPELGFCASTNWGAVAAFSFVIANITAIAITILYGEYYLAIPFGVGTLGSLYLLNLTVNSTDKNNEGSCVGMRNFCGNVTSNWRAIPALILLVTCIIGVVMALLMNEPYLTIPFGAGILCAIYLLNLASDFQNLSDYQENNARFEDSNNRLAIQLDRAEDQLRRKDNQLDRQEQQIEELDKKNAAQDRLITQQLESLAKIKTLEDTLADLQKNAAQAEKEKAENHKKFVSQLQGLLGTAANNKMIREDEREQIRKVISSAESATNMIAQLEILQNNFNAATVANVEGWKVMYAAAEAMQQKNREAEEASEKRMHALRLQIITETVNLEKVKKEFETTSKKLQVIQTRLDDTTIQQNQLVRVASENLRKSMSKEQWEQIMKDNPTGSDAPSAPPLMNEPTRTDADSPSSAPSTPTDSRAGSPVRSPSPPPIELPPSVSSTSLSSNASSSSSSSSSSSAPSVTSPLPLSSPVATSSPSLSSSASSGSSSSSSSPISSTSFAIASKKTKK